ncbi:MAG: alpha/beta hydrolase-fold protein [Bacteroidales bacterium]|nr:alpha/beta hydrolase-fold protein [Bacteroidales bacterium]
MMKTKFLLLLLITQLTGLTYAKEADKTEKLTEGLVIQNGVIYGRNIFIIDPQAEDIIMDRFERPRDGMASGKNPGGEEALWEKITADEDGYFKSGKLRGGALYIEYNSPRNRIMLLNASGHTMVFVNGEPREGDHYDFNYSLHPVMIKKGLNQFYFTNGRFPRIRASLEEASSEIIIKKKDLTLPDLVIEEPGFKWGGLTLINASDKYKGGLSIKCTVKDTELTTTLPGIEKLTSKRMNFKIPVPENMKAGESEVLIEVFSGKGLLYDSYRFKIKIKPFAVNHDRTFISKIDGSVQYYSVTPSTRPLEKDQALFLSVHGAGVQARNQAWTYDAKDWGHVVAPTNRGPFGFAWEDWGRLDALEVLEEGKKLFETRHEKTFLTGHSMGGHGTWYLGASYPDKFAAIAPCAGYPDLLMYAGGDAPMQLMNDMSYMFFRAGRSSRIPDLARNYIHHGVYVYHGDSDPTVSVEMARLMRGILGDFHPDFTYYEYPGGTHWYGDISMDWPPIFDYFKLHGIQASRDLRKLEFHTANPGISASSHWVNIHQQIKPFEISSIEAHISNDSSRVIIDTRNILTMGLKTGEMGIKSQVVLEIDATELVVDRAEDTAYRYFRFTNGEWSPCQMPGEGEKGPHRYGGFKDAFRKNMIFVYGTSGGPEEDRWNYLKARFDAETFAYRGNGSADIITDRQFRDGNFEGRNVILYGNADNNLAWDMLLTESPVQVFNNSIVIGDRTITGDDIACYFIRPLKGSEDNSVGIIAGSGLKGMKSGYPNQYFIAGPAFPDLVVFRMTGDADEFSAAECAGFFGNDWSITGGELTWK